MLPFNFIEIYVSFSPVPFQLVHCIGKLYRLPVSVQHLKDTGIGRTVNGLRKYDGEVGVAAKALVSKWKNMVAAEESDTGEPDSQHHQDEEDHEEQQDEGMLLLRCH